RILTEVDYVLCEDTRITQKLLNHYQIKAKTISYHQHSRVFRVEQILSLLKKGNNLALVSDSGTPGISDPGGKLVREVVDKMGERVQVESVPGPSAVAAALSVSGLPTDKFVFLGFPPHKKGRQKFIKNIFNFDFPAMVYESKHRIAKFLQELAGVDDSVYVVIARELSKMHETIYRGELEQILKNIKEDKEALKEKGEFVIIIKKAG
ncbi:MAG TPA: 16S rRNA (cytidine(1402)-2'-O)-methyltransferase, partial [Patescibacteria group bacterium]|nr:16S rRNA (cytidine(1402)-2'-O)-methyltransferase [Patescibacteria group bacterium]